MSGEDFYFVAKRYYFVDNATHNPTVIATRKVGTANALAEQGIARKQYASLLVVEADVAGGVAGGVDKLESGVAKRDTLLSFEVDVGCGDIFCQKAKDRSAQIGRVNQKIIVAVQAILNDRAYAECVVEVAVCIDRHYGF